MAGSSSNPLTSSSTPHTDPLFHSEPPYSAPNPDTSPPLSAAARFAGTSLSGGGSGGSGGSGSGNANGTSGSGRSGGSGSGGSGRSGSGGGTHPHSECKVVELRGVRVASFTVSGVELICLPQVFELFLKHLVGGLHTVYTKLKRLHISPVVCTVEQVRVLRGLGAIQPGVNRCKLITRADFETLYRDCTNASSRPGRPPKRMLGVATMADGSRLLPHGLISPALLSQTGLTAAMAEVMKLQKMRMMMSFHGNSDSQTQHNGTESEIEELNSNAGGSDESWEKEQRLLSPPPSLLMGSAPPPGSASLLQHSTLLTNRLSDLPFVVMPHPLLPVGLPPASIAMAMNQMSQLSGLVNMAAVSQVQQLEENKESPPGSPSPSNEELHREQTNGQSPSRESSSSSSSPPPTYTPELDESLLPRPLLKSAYEKTSLTSQLLPNPAFAPFLLAEGLSSMETLLTNIQGFLKVAVESARSQDKKNQLERKELKLELERERDARQILQRQLSSELQTRVSIQRRLRKEKRMKRRLQDALDLEWRRREEVERSFKHSDSLSDEAPENKQQQNSAEGRTMKRD